MIGRLVMQHTPSLLYEGLTTDNLASVHCQPFHFVRIHSSEFEWVFFFFVCFLFIFCCLFFDQTRLSASCVQHPHTHHHNELELQI